MRLAMTGFGNVGQGVAHLIGERGDLYEREFGIRLLLTGVADRQGAAVDANGLDGASLLEAKREGGTVAAANGGERGLGGAEFLLRTGANVFVEAASTNFEDAEPGWSTIRAALDLGMDVVMASKGALVLHYRELMEEAGRVGRQVRFSATTGAPLPVLELIDGALPGADILGFEGVMNGTSNAILASMAEGKTYDEGVRLAQERGIAETDPTLDVDGWDAAAKAAIVANAAFGTDLGISDVERRGIRDVTPGELEEAARQGCTIKLVSRAVRNGGTARAQVRPEVRSANDPLGRLVGHEMGIVFHTQPLGDITASVERTGDVPGGILTAMTVLRDVVNLARERDWSSREEL